MTTEEQINRFVRNTAHLKLLAARLRHVALYEPRDHDADAVDYAVKILERMLRRLREKEDAVDSDK